MKIISWAKQMVCFLIGKLGYTLISSEELKKDKIFKVEKNSREFRQKVQEKSLLHSYSNIYSQRGDDGIISEIFKRLKVDSGFFIEFGAWDGIYLSNCRLLFEKGWGGLFIESDRDRCMDLKKEYSPYPDIVCANEMVSPDGKNGKKLDDIIDSCNIKKEISFLSIDIDGLDLNIFESLKVRPLVVCIEGGFSWHPSISERVPNEIAKRNLQQPLKVAVESVIKNGYQPVCFNQNLYAVRKEYTDLFADIDASAERLYLDAFYFFDDNFRSHLVSFRKNNQDVQALELGYKEIIPGY